MTVGVNAVIIGGVLTLTGTIPSAGTVTPLSLTIFGVGLALTAYGFNTMRSAFPDPSIGEMWTPVIPGIP